MNNITSGEAKTIPLINCFNDAVILFRKEITGDAYCLLESNRAALDLFGYSKDEFSILCLRDIFFKTTYNNFTKAKDLTNVSEGFCVDKTGKIFPVEFYVNRFSPDDDIFILVVKDTTLKKQNELQLSRYIEELHENKDMMEKNAYELVLLNVKLEQSEEELKILNASKDKFFSIIAHDLKSPFSSFIGLTELLAEDFNLMEIEEVKTLLGELHKNAKNVFSLLENLLNWARVQTGRMDFTPEYLSPARIVDNISVLYESIASQKKLIISSEVITEKKIFADLNMVETVMRNLVSNAIKFTREDGHVSIKAEDLNGMVQFSIQDSGTGISAENMAKLFRIDTHYSCLGTKNEKGTGLGLILCKDLVEMNGGAITVESKPGEGTKFSFTLPVEPVTKKD